MTEEEWLACNDPTPMLEFLRENVRDRKLRLFAVAWCRRIWRRLKDERWRNVVLVSERLADGLPTKKELEAGMELSLIFTRELGIREDLRPTGAALFVTQVCRDRMRIPAPGAASYRLGTFAESTAQCNLLRDIFGNPFRPLPINTAWLTPTVINLATIAYEERAMPSGELDNNRLAILADALEEAGSDNQEILTHLRSPGPHVRGCHVLDLLLGKE